jgi:sulfur carrier protein
MQLSITVALNGEAISLPDGASLGDLIKLLGKESSQIATAVNETFIPKEQRSETKLCHGDAIMTFEPITGG